MPPRKSSNARRKEQALKERARKAKETAEKVKAKRMDRRTFLKRAVAGAVGIALAGSTAKYAHEQYIRDPRGSITHYLTVHQTTEHGNAMEQRFEKLQKEHKIRFHALAIEGTGGKIFGKDSSEAVEYLRQEVQKRKKQGQLKTEIRKWFNKRLQSMNSSNFPAFAESYAWLAAWNNLPVHHMETGMSSELKQITSSYKEVSQQNADASQVSFLKGVQSAKIASTAVKDFRDPRNKNMANNISRLFQELYKNNKRKPVHMFVVNGAAHFPISELVEKKVKKWDGVTVRSVFQEMDEADIRYPLLQVYRERREIQDVDYGRVIVKNYVNTNSFISPDNVELQGRKMMKISNKEWNSIHQKLNAMSMPQLKELDGIYRHFGKVSPSQYASIVEAIQAWPVPK